MVGLDTKFRTILRILDTDKKFENLRNSRQIMSKIKVKYVRICIWLPGDTLTVLHNQKRRKSIFWLPLTNLRAPTRRSSISLFLWRLISISADLVINCVFSCLHGYQSCFLASYKIILLAGGCIWPCGQHVIYISPVKVIFRTISQAQKFHSLL